MTEYVQVVLIANLFRALCLIVGLSFAYLGYRLYIIGVFEKAQEVKASLGGAHIVLKQVAPGIAFVAFGMIVASIGVVRPVTVDRGPTQMSSQTDIHATLSDKGSSASDVFIPRLNDDLVQKISTGATLTQSERDRIVKLIHDHDQHMWSSMSDGKKVFHEVRPSDEKLKK